MNAKTLAALSILSVAPGLAGCGDNSAPAPAPTTPTTTPAATQTVANAARIEADKLMSDMTMYLKDNKLQLADGAIARLQEIKPNLPPEYGPKIDDLKQMLETAKKAGPLKMPG